jgi:Tfp pilus assembly protein PilN
MRVVLNLAALPSRRERYAFAWTLPVIVLGAVGLIYLAVFSVRNFQEYRRVQNDIVALQNQNSRLSLQEANLKRSVERPEDRMISRQAQYINSLIEAKKISVADLTLKVSKLMPETAHLATLSLGQGEGPFVQFSVIGKDEEALEDFLTALEDSPDFGDVAVESEGIQSQGDQSVPMTIKCTARYVGSVLH